MHNKLRSIRNVVIVVVLASLAGFGVSSAAFAASMERTEVPPFEVNASGQTFGRGDGEVDPDLIRAQGTNGEVGYVLKTDLLGPELSSPEEVAEWLREFPQDRPRDIPLYESDGRTVIGTFTLAPVEVDPIDAH